MRHLGLALLWTSAGIWSLWKHIVVSILTFLYTHTHTKGYTSVGERHSRLLPWQQVDLVRSELWKEKQDENEAEACRSFFSLSFIRHILSHQERESL